MNLTPQQAAFVSAIVNGSGHKCLRARAGTGKTSTILAAVQAYVQAHPAHEVAVCAFGKAIQVEIEAKLKQRGIDWKRCQAVTSHSMGFGLVRFAFKGVKVDNNKVRDILRAENAPVFSAYFGPISDLVHLAKLEGFGFFDDAQIGDAHAWYRLAEHYGANGFDDTSTMDAVIEAAQHIYRKSLATNDIVDFDDMVLFPLVKGLRVKYGKDLIFVDEAQDTSRARRALVQLFLKPRGRLIVVGDDRQAIMGFAGASADALDEWIAAKQAEVLPLTMTWRCPKAVVAEAQRIVPDIVAAEGAIEGKVTRATALPVSLEPTDAILCRNTAPLVATAYSLIRRGIACRVEGREIGTGLLRLVDRWKQITTIGAFLTKLEEYRDRETQKAVAKGKDAKVDEINDRCDTLIAICDAVKAKKLSSLDDVRKFIGELFQDNVGVASPMLVLCTYHRSKGREWPRVMLLEHAKRCPSPWAKQDWEIRQELNLAYVAITRAQQELIYVDIE